MLLLLNYLERFSIYPNPATDVVNVTGTALTNVSIVDINGRAVKSQPLNANKTSADENSTTKKIIIHFND